VFEKTIREVIVPDFDRNTGAQAQVPSGQPKQSMAQIEANRAYPVIDVMFNNVDGAIPAGQDRSAPVIAGRRATRSQGK